MILPGLKSRPRCPFYGFHWPAKGSSLIEAGTPECGLDLYHHGPCKMELEQMTVDFDRCHVRKDRQYLLDAGKRYIRFHADELPSDGVPLEKWHDVVMRKQQES